MLCNNAGIERYARADEYSINNFNAVVETTAGHVPVREIRPAAPASRRSSIVNVSSVQGVANEPSISVYASAKAGILGLTRGMAVDFAPLGVRSTPCSLVRPPIPA